MSLYVIYLILFVAFPALNDSHFQRNNGGFTLLISHLNAWQQQIVESLKKKRKKVHQNNLFSSKRI